MFKNLLRRIARALFRPSPIVWAANLARIIVPVFEFKGTVFVFRHDDVSDLLERQADFGVAKLYAEEMALTTGPFFLGMDDGPRYQLENTFARSGIHKGDLDRLVATVDNHAPRILAAHGESGQIDLVSDYFRRIPVIILAEFFGVTSPGSHTPEDEKKLAGWMRSIFWDLFLNLDNNKDVQARGIEAGGEAQEHLRALVREQRARLAEGKAVDDTFLGRLVAATTTEQWKQLDDDAVVRNVGGVIVGSVDTVSKSCSLIFEELTHRPEELTLARAAAKAGDDATLKGILFEALRFNPHNPILLRHASRDTEVAKGTKRSRVIKAGTQVMPVLVSATFDPNAIERPKEFDPRRRLSQSMNFGWGLHRCFGEHLVYATVPAMMRALLCCDELIPQRSAYSPYTSEGPFPDSYPAKIRVGAGLQQHSANESKPSSTAPASQAS